MRRKRLSRFNQADRAGATRFPTGAANAPESVQIVRQLQKEFGNNAFGKEIEARLGSAPPDPSASSNQIPAPKIQRMCSDCKEEKVLRQMDEEEEEASEETLQTMKANGDAGQGSHSRRHVPAIVRAVIKSSGRPVDQPARTVMEHRFGRSFDDVRVHTGAAAAESAKAVSALAYTVSNHIVFGASQYSPSTNEGRRLLAHELTHTVQQSGSSLDLQRLSLDAGPQSSLEQEADRVATGQISPSQISIGSLGTVARVQRITTESAGACGPCMKAANAGTKAHSIATAEFEIEALGRGEFALVVPHKGKGKREAGRLDMVTIDDSTHTMHIGELKPANESGKKAGKKDMNYYLSLAQRAAQSDKYFSYRMTKKQWDPAGITFPFPSTKGVGCTQFMTITGPDENGVYLYECTPPKSVLEATTCPCKPVKKKKKGKDKGKGKGKQAAQPDVDPKQPKPDADVPKKTPEPDVKKPQAKGGNIGFGISIFSSGSGAGNAGVGISILSDGVSFGTVSAGIAFNSDGIAVGTASAGLASGGSSQAIGSASAGSSVDSPSTAAGTASAGSVEGSDTMAAGSASAGEMKGSSGTSVGEAATGKVEGIQESGKGSKKGEGKPGGKGERPGQETLIPGKDPASIQAAIDEAAEIEKMAKNASDPQRKLIGRIAANEGDPAYQVPSQVWVKIFLTATEGISDEDLAYLETLNWRPANVTAEELKKQVQEALKNKNKPKEEPKPDDKPKPEEKAKPEDQPAEEKPPPEAQEKPPEDQPQQPAPQAGGQKADATKTGAGPTEAEKAKATGLEFWKLHGTKAVKAVKSDVEDEKSPTPTASVPITLTYNNRTYKFGLHGVLVSKVDKPHRKFIWEGKYDFRPPSSIIKSTAGDNPIYFTDSGQVKQLHYGAFKPAK